MCERDCERPSEGGRGRTARRTDADGGYCSRRRIPDADGAKTLLPARKTEMVDFPRNRTASAFFFFSSTIIGMASSRSVRHFQVTGGRSIDSRTYIGSPRPRLTERRMKVRSTIGIWDPRRPSSSSPGAARPS